MDALYDVDRIVNGFMMLFAVEPTAPGSNHI